MLHKQAQETDLVVIIHQRAASLALNKQEAQLSQRNSASAAHTCAADSLFLCDSCIGIGTCRSWNAQNTAESPRLYYFWHSNAL